MKHYLEPLHILIITLSACILTLFPVASQAGKVVEFNGNTYTLSDNVFLLDAENIYGNEKSFRNPTEAFAQINELKGNGTLLVAPSVYWLDNPDDQEVRTDKGGIPFAVRLHCDTLSIIGLSENPEDIVFAVNRGQTQGAVGNFTMFHFSGKCLTTQNITFGNYCNVDLDYQRNPEFNRKKRKDAIVQAQIGICEGTDRLFAENCRFISRLNLCPFVGARRSLYDNCYFECTDDALSGSAIYLDCRFTFLSSKPFYSTAETGAVFLNCDITCLGSGVQYFTKVPGQVTAIDTRFYCENPIEIKWTRDESDIICRQENISLNGMPYVIDANRRELGPQLHPSKIRDAYVAEHNGDKFYNLPNLLNGDDGWDPKGMKSYISKIESETHKKFSNIPVALRIGRDGQKPIADGDKVEVHVLPLLWGGYPKGDKEILIYDAKNDLPEEKKVVMPISTKEELTGRLSLTIEPKLRKAPKFQKKPQARYDEKAKTFVVDYTLTGKGDDNSKIIWCRIMNEGNPKHVVALEQGEAPKGKFFKADAGDLGYGILAAVFPKFNDSAFGNFETTSIIEISDPSQVEELPESRLCTDFSNLCIVEREPGIPGVWSFDVFKPADTAHVDWQPNEGPGWYYGKGFDASVSTGLVQNEKGARLSYVPARDACNDMIVSLIAEPAKSGGQGFGSATSQYMDICIKFDPINLDGYALRIERTPDHDRAVKFTLVKYEKGKTSVISEEAVSNCFRTPCYIKVGIEDCTLHAEAYSGAYSAPKCCNEVVERVDLIAQVESNSYTGFCIQHTGSVGPSSTLIRDVNINWE